MDIERGNVEILFKNIPYDRITINCLNKNECHDYRTVNKNIFMQYSYSVFPYYSADERNNCYRKLIQDMIDSNSGKSNIFIYIMAIAKKLLIYDGYEVKCRFEELLRWRELSFQVGQDFFTCAFLAKYDLNNNYDRKFFAWAPIIYSDNARLRNILEHGIADNHFHYTCGFSEKRQVHNEKGLRLQLTYHAGEDFLDIADGLRAIDEAIMFCGLERGCRIGHALALGINPKAYYEYKNYKVVLPKQVLLDDIAWILCRASELGCEFVGSFRSRLEETFHQLYEEIYGKVLSGKHISIQDYYQSWKLRGDDPMLYRMPPQEFEAYLKHKNCHTLDGYRINPRIEDYIRKVSKYNDLYYLYHFSEAVRKEGNKIIDYKIENEYIFWMKQLQDKLIEMVIKKGIGIETNPSSNYLIGTIQKYEEHPIVRFNSRKLKNVLVDRSISVSINTDDQGVFDTLLENEYALMALALQKAKTEKGEHIYDIEDIYEWLDYVRKMGLEQIFRIEDNE